MDIWACLPSWFRERVNERLVQSSDINNNTDTTEDSYFTIASSIAGMQGVVRECKCTLDDWSSYPRRIGRISTVVQTGARYSLFSTSYWEGRETYNPWNLRHFAFCVLLSHRWRWRRNKGRVFVNYLRLEGKCLTNFLLIAATTAVGRWAYKSEIHIAGRLLALPYLTRLKYRLVFRFWLFVPANGRYLGTYLQWFDIVVNWLEALSWTRNSVWVHSASDCKPLLVLIVPESIKLVNSCSEGRLDIESCIEKCRPADPTTIFCKWIECTVHCRNAGVGWFLKAETVQSKVIGGCSDAYCSLLGRGSWGNVQLYGAG